MLNVDGVLPVRERAVVRLTAAYPLKSARTGVVDPEVEERDSWMGRRNVGLNLRDRRISDVYIDGNEALRPEKGVPECKV